MRCKHFLHGDMGSTEEAIQESALEGRDMGRKEQDWSQRRVEAYEKWEQLKDQRFAEVQNIITHYGAEIFSTSTA